MPKQTTVKRSLYIAVVLIVVMLVFALHVQNQNHHLKQVQQELQAQIQILQARTPDAAGPLAQALSANARANTKASTSAPAAQDVARPVAATGCTPSVPESETGQALQAIATQNTQALVEQKYALFWQDVELDENQQQQLQQLLFERERIQNASTTHYFSDDLDVMLTVDQHQQLMAQTEAAIEALLPPEAYRQFGLFKNAGAEQYQLTRFENQLAADEQLDASQAHAVLLAKLRHKQQFEQALEHVSLSDSHGSEPEKLIGQAVQDYKTAFLADAQMLLSESQFEKLSDFETGEFEDIYSSLMAARMQ